MAKWRPLEDYSPFARLLVEYMWEQRPPLLPNQFAQRMGVRKQQVSNWLNSDATPSPQTLMRLARGMGRPVSEVFITSGATAAADPLFDLEEAWTHTLTEVQTTPEFKALAEPQQIVVIGVLHAAHLRDRATQAKLREVPNGTVVAEPVDADESADAHDADGGVADQSGITPSET